MTHKILVGALILLGASPALAQDPVGCDSFKWPIAQERAALVAPDLARLEAGAQAPALPPTAAHITLRALPDAALPKPPERNQKPGTFAGALHINALPAGTYTVSVSDYAWVDVVQNGDYVRPSGHSGVKGCEGIRKSMKFDLGAGPATIQISGVAKDAINIAILPAAK